MPTSLARFGIRPRSSRLSNRIGSKASNPKISVCRAKVIPLLGPDRTDVLNQTYLGPALHPSVQLRGPLAQKRLQVRCDAAAR